MREGIRRALAWVKSALLGRVTLPGWLAIAMAVFLGIPAWNDAVNFWLETAKTSPLWLATAAPIVTSQYFAPALGLAGFIYLAIVGYEGTSIVRHRIVPIVGWVVLGVCVVSVVVTAGVGATEIYILTEIAKGVAGVPRDTSPATNNQTRPQRPLQSQSRFLQPDQVRILLEELPKLRQFASHMIIATAPNDNEAVDVARQYFPLFDRSGIRTSGATIYPNGPEDEGILIGVANINNPPEAAQKLREILSIADIHAELRSIKNNALLSDDGVMLFIAPAHIN
jgi:hypothetical protein